MSTRTSNRLSRAISAAVLTGLASASLVAMSAPPAHADATRLLVDWEMNESAGSTVMLDSGPNGIDGSIGSAVLTGATFDGATGYRWPFASPTLPPAKPERIVQASDGRLNPGSGDYAVTLRYRTIQPFGNIIQKGQGGAPGGYFKIENPAGILTCVFRGVDSSGNFMRKEVNSGIKLNDGQWHTARCERTENQLTLTIDGSLTVTTSGRTGSISNPRPISIAGKLNCDQESITCDYFTGDIDWITIEGEEAAPPPPPPGGVVFSDDFGSGTFSAWTSVRNLSIDGSEGGAAPPSALADPSSTVAWAAKDLDGSFSAVCVDLTLRVTSASGSVDLMRLRTAGNGNIAKLVLSSTGSLQFRSDVSGVTRNTGTTLPDGWHELRLCGTVGTTGTWDLFLDDAKILDAWAANTGTTPVGRVQIGSNAGETLTIHYDDVVVYG